MRGFRKIYGVNWLTATSGERTTVLCGTNKADVVLREWPLPEHWERVKQILLTK